MVGVGQRHRAAGLVEEVADIAIMCDADFRVMHNVLKVIVFVEIQNHRAQHLELDVVFVAVDVEVGLATNDFVDGHGGAVGGLSPAVLKDLEEAVEVLRLDAKRGKNLHSKSKC